MHQKSDLPGYEDLEPAAVWTFFAGLSAHPRPSKKEERVRAHIESVARELGLATRTDTAGNLVIEVPATRGCEAAPVIVLQGHLDMVCEKNSGTVHDFDRDSITLIVDRDAEEGRIVVRADGTTLGADNGIGLALSLAVATSPEVTHGPLEILCTIDEEMGMGGASALKPDFLRGRRLLNLDSEDSALYIGCAGGCDATLRWNLAGETLAASSTFCRVTVRGLRGGHSGGDIHLHRANAIRTLARTLLEDEVPSWRLVQVEGGSLRNAIPREAFAIVAGATGLAAALTAAAAHVQDETVALGEEGCRIMVETIPADGRGALSAEQSVVCLRTILAIPHGVLGLVVEIPGLVESSNNVATVKTETLGERIAITVGCMARSSSTAELHLVAGQITSVGRLGAAQVEIGNAYPGWKPSLDSPILKTCRAVYRKVHGTEPLVTAIHAGLECGIIGERVPGMDMISFGPDVRGAHSPDERCYVDSVQRNWEYLKAVLLELSR
jgi:dipeptidase D